MQIVACQNNGDIAFLKQSQALHDKQIIGKHIKNCPKPYFHILQIFYTFNNKIVLLHHSCDMHFQ